MANSKTKSGDGFVTGIVLIIVGIIALCAIFFDLHIVWSQMLKLWPLLLIIIGVTMIPVNRWIRTGIVVLILICGAIGYHSLEKKYYGKGNAKVEIFDDNDWDFFDESIEKQEDKFTKSKDSIDNNLQEFSEPYRKGVTKAEVEVSYGAGSLKIGSPTSNLIFASNSSAFIRQGFNVRYDGSNEAEIKISSEGKTDKLKKQDNKFTMSLNTKPVWDFDFELGACDVDFDFSDYKVSEIDFEGGVCNVDMKIGNLYENTKINIETGVSSITISIPADAGCHVECESALSNKSFDGLKKVGSGTFETDNYGTARQNIVIDLSCALSNVVIKRY